jgi:RNA polymerase sigma-70 factor (ECF subfamily)
VIPAQRDADSAPAGVAPPIDAAPPAGEPSRAGVAAADVEPATMWALAARDGDPLAQAAFVRATQAEVWRFTAALVDRGTADDLTQETYLRAFRALPGYEGRASARTWLLGIARRTCVDHIRTLVRRRRLHQRLAVNRYADATCPDASGRLDAADLLRRLSGERRSAFALTQVVGLSYAEAAEVEGVPVGTIRSRVARARADLMVALGEALAS